MLYVIVFYYVDLEYSKFLHIMYSEIRLFQEQDALGSVTGLHLIVNILELEKGNGELYMMHINLNVTMVYLKFS